MFIVMFMSRSCHGRRVTPQESPRFLLANGRAAEAELVLRTATSRAGVAPPDTGALEATGPAADRATEAEEAALPAQARSQPAVARGTRVWTSALLCELAVVSAVWLAVNLLFYGLDFAVGSCSAAAGCNTYAHAALTGVADLPGYLVSKCLSDAPRFGRRLTLVLSFLLGSASLLLMPVLQARLPRLGR